MEYNTQRPQLKISDYGRNIHKLIQYAKGIEDRDRRNQVARAIVDVMSRNEKGEVNRHEDKRKYWVHLMVLADWDLDIDLPYDIPREESTSFAPRRIAYNQSEPRYRHYGRVMEEMVKRAAEFPEGEERDALVGQIAHAMKRDYLLWNRDTVENEIIDAQLNQMSDGRLHVPEGFQYREAKEYMKGSDVNMGSTPKKKKKKKKKKNGIF